jgi:predicted nucleic acid-binding Zn ribbon protein
MALFTNKADLDLPVLTRFYQVANDDELALFFSSRATWEFRKMIVSAEESKAMWKNLSGDYDVPGQINPNAPVQNRQRYEQRRPSLILFKEDEMKRFREIHSLTRQIMDSLFQGFIRAGDLKKLLHLRRMNIGETFSQGSLHNGGIDVSRLADDETVQVCDLEYSYAGSEQNSIYVSILDGLRDLLASPNPFPLGRCSVCSNPFLLLRDGHTLCSKRCGDRLAQRRLRAHQIIILNRSE